MSPVADAPVRTAVPVRPAPPVDRSGWGWATVRAGGRNWAVSGAPSRRPCPRRRRPARRDGRIRAALRDWARRYLLAEGVGTLVALAAALLVHGATGSLATAALAASVAESVAYYAVVLRRLLPALWLRHEGLPPGRRLLRTARDSVAEGSDFLAAELFDTVLLRPLLIWLAAGWTGSHLGWGLLIGKLLADLGFYAVVIPTYELRKRMVSR